MNKVELEITKVNLKAEKKTLNELQQIYKKARQDVQQKIAELNSRTDMQNLQSIVYQKKYQQVILDQINEALADLKSGQYKTVNEYLTESYDNGYLGMMYSLQSQDIPIIMPIDDRKVVKALTTDSKLVVNYYKADPVRGRLEEDIDLLKTRIRTNLSRGIVAGKSWLDVAVDIATGMNNTFDTALKDAMRIVRTEGHRVNQQGFLDAGDVAKSKGADILKQWDSTMDKHTRPWHREADGQIVEWDEDFIVMGERLKAPSIGGSARNVCNCRCQLLQRARWMLDEDELKELQERAEFFGLDKTKSFEEYKQKYLTVSKTPEVVVKQKTIFTPAKTIAEAEEYGKRFVVEKTWSKDGRISYKGLSVDGANEFNRTLTNLFDTFEMPKFNNILPMNFRERRWKGSDDTPMAYVNNLDGGLFFNAKMVKSPKAVEEYFKKGKEAYVICEKNLYRLEGSQKELVEKYVKAGRSLVAGDAENKMSAMIQHEVGHHIQNKILYRDKEAVKIVKDGFEPYGSKLSGYSTYTHGEYIAESFCAFMNGESDRIDPALKSYFEGLMK